tara:strand:+ start:370 stop:3072 length:2703 start_codon:yes stop_codon:yes gene_type:complete
MITIDDRLKSSSVDELWAIKLFYETDSAITIERSSQDFVFFQSAGSLSITDLTPTTSDKFRSFVINRGRKYLIQIPNATAQQQSDAEGIYNLKLSIKGTLQCDNPKVSSFLPFLTDKLVITPINPYFPLSTAPYTDSGGEYYDPVITRVGSLNDSIDVIKSKAKTSNFSFSILNTSAKQIGGATSSYGYDYLRFLATSDKDYQGTSCINKICEVYSVASGQTSPTKIYHGRVSKISYSKGQIKVDVNSEKPFSNRTIPSNRDVNTNQLGTLAYGDFEGNETQPMLYGNRFFPAPYSFSTNRYAKNFFKLPANLVSYNNVIPHYYDKSNNKYLPLYKTDRSTKITETQDDGSNYYSVLDNKFTKQVIIKGLFGDNYDVTTEIVSGQYYLAQWGEGDSTDPVGSGASEGDLYSNSSIKHIYDFPNIPAVLGNSPTPAYNTYGASYLKVEYQVTSSAYTPSFMFLRQVPVGAIKLSLGHDHEIIALGSNNDVEVTMYYSDLDFFEKSTLNTADYNTTYTWKGGTAGVDIILMNGDVTYSGLNFSNVVKVLQTGSTGTTSGLSNVYLSKAEFEGMGDPRLCIRNKVTQFNGLTAEQNANAIRTHFIGAKIRDLILTFWTNIDTSDLGNVEKDIKNIEHVYIGVDGIKKSWDTANPCTLPHHIHRDLLWRECGITTTPDGWADLETNRSNFRSRYWVLKETDLEKELDKMQEEGAFIFRYNAQGNPSYLYVKNSYSSSDVKATIGRNHISSISSSVTPFQDLITKINFRHGVDPATNNYSAESTYEKTDSRERYGLSEKEQVMDKSLDIIHGHTFNNNPSAVEELSNYYFNIASQTKSLVDVVVVDPFMLGLEIGDIIKFDNVTLDKEIIGNADGQLQSKYYMIVKLNRSLGKGIKIQAREVYQS